jgi:hypothetical protein
MNAIECSTGGRLPTEALTFLISVMAPPERLFVGPARMGGVARVGVAPNPGELLRSAASVDLLVQEVGHGCVIEPHAHRRGVLADEANVLDQ